MATETLYPDENCCILFCYFVGATNLVEGFAAIGAYPGAYQPKKPVMKRVFNTDLPGNYGHLALLLFRISVACLMLTHGFPKLQRLLSGEEIQFADPYGLGVTTSFVLVVFAEFFCSILVILGAATRLAAIPIIITMTTAVIFAHANDPFGVKEKPLLFLVCFVFLLIIGAGKYSVDNSLRKS